MARYTGPVCKLCRREGIKLFLKGERCYSSKCAIERRGYAPGQHGQRRGKVTEYGVQLREKQKVRRIYGVLEKQFRRVFDAAERQRGITGENLLVLLERRLDNMVFRMGFGPSRTAARQLVLHGHVKLNGKVANVASMLVKPQDLIQVSGEHKEGSAVRESVKAQEKRGFPGWVSVDVEKLSGTVKSLPAKDDIALPVKEQLIVELYSK
ncbi:MAG: 30S ribosomal protein S4 [candidate division FCPU426 bacterium]